MRYNTRHADVPHRLSRCHSERHQTGHHHLGAERWRLRGDSAHQTCASLKPACARCSPFPPVCGYRRDGYTHTTPRLVFHNAVQHIPILTWWHLGATVQWGWATPGHESWPDHRGMGCSSSRSCTPHWSPFPPQHHQMQLQKIHHLMLENPQIYHD